MSVFNSQFGLLFASLEIFEKDLTHQLSAHCVNKCLMTEGPLFNHDCKVEIHQTNKNKPICAQAKHMSNVKAEDKMAELGGEKGVHMKTFHEYDLVAMGIPVSARPIAGLPYLGKHGYTLKSSTGAVL